MDVQVLDRNVGITSSQRENVERCLHFSLDRFAEIIRSVQVSFSDMNGPKGGDGLQATRIARLATDEAIRDREPTSQSHPSSMARADKVFTSDLMSPLDVEEPEDAPPSTLPLLLERHKQ